jgi:Flp pilus assembly protein TadG
MPEVFLMRSSLNVSIAAACALRRFRRDRNGSVAIQFAMIATPFLMMMFAIIEICMIFFATQVLETATHDTARLIMTGQAQMAGMSATQFKADLCARLAGLFNCAGVDVDVKSYPAFANIGSLNNPISGGNYNNPTTFQPGSAGQIVVVRTFYQWPLFVTNLGYNAGNLNNNKRLLVSTASFRNEPGPF